MSVLGLFDWAYLKLEHYGNTEIIKVYLTYSGLQVDRGQDGTERHAFPAGTEIKYALTQVEIQDATPASPLNVYPDLSSYAQVSGSNGEFIIGYPFIATQFEGGIRAYYTESDATLHIDDWFPAAGCCSIAGNGAPLIGGPFFYLTSQLYPVEVIEEFIAPNPDTDKNHHGTNPFGPGPLWTLTQPVVSEGYVGTGPAAFGPMNVFGGQKTYTDTEQYVASYTVTMGPLNTFGGQAAGSVLDQYVSGNAYILQLLVYGNDVQYNNDIEKYIKSLVSITNITVS